LREAVRLAKFRREREQGRYVLRSDVNEMLGRAGSLIRGRLYAALEREFPARVYGRTHVEISAVGRALADELMGFLHNCDSDARSAVPPVPEVGSAHELNEAAP
jgi:hypothetical protein